MGNEGPSDTTDNKKSHRERHSGRKATKKKSKKEAQNPVLEDQTAKQRNPKAFAFNSAIRAERRFRRKQDVETKKQHIPLVDRTPIEPPPILIAVVGPPKVGKTTLVNNLIKLFTKSPLSDVKGPVTIVTGKKRRITLIECNNDINSMIDLAKIADLVLLLCDASFGFEMEVFEFLNICQVHGMPRIMGVLTHLDQIKNSKTLKTTKKTLKHRFWTEVYPGAKLFYLSGIIHGEYMRNEIKNLGRFISVMKLRPLTWRITHSYLLGDRYEDLTNQELLRQNPKCDRNISLYGYVRGVPIKKESSVHVPGLGDLRISDISYLPDPCPLPDQIKKRALVEKEKLIYAPFSGIGGIVYDKDAVYVELGGSHSHNKRGNDDETDNIVTNLIEAKETLDVKMQHSEMQIFTGGQKLTAKDWEDNEEDQPVELYEKNTVEKDDDDLDDELEELREGANYSKKQELVEDDGRIRRRVVFDVSDEELNESLDDDDSSGSDSEDDPVKWKENMQKKAQDAFLDRQSTQNLMRLVYGIFDVSHKEKDKAKKLEEEQQSKEEDNIGGLFTKVSKAQQVLKQDKDSMNLVESSLMMPWNAPTKDWLEVENKALIANCFVTGKWKDSEDASELLKLDDAEDLSDMNSEFGDFEDLETGEKHTAAPSGEKRKRSKDEPADQEALAEKKRKLKEKFDADYDNTDKSSYYDDLKSSAEKQAQLNKSEFESMPDDVRVQIEGFRPGMYVRVEFQGVPAEFIEHFDPTYPLVVGALNMGEENIGYVNVRVKKHRWYNRILKTSDPLIISLGWRRFQTVPLYSKLEDDLKFRYLKYTPEHLACNAHFWGPITPQGTGFLALQTLEYNAENAKKIGFRIAATGTVQELDKSTQIMKKLKLIGHPLKIYKKTAFIKGMFNSALEVARFEGARVKTVSGIRGQIKKAVSKPEGCYRATFEDKIQLSDIVFCRTWYKVDVPQFYNPVTTLLLPPDQKNSWRGMRTTGEIKREKGIRNAANKDSLYTPVVRQVKPFRPLIIPAKLQRALPYRDKPKNSVRDDEKKKEIERVAVVREPYEQKVSNMMKMIKAAYEHKQSVLKKETKERMEKHRQTIEAVEADKLKKIKLKKKEVFRKKSKSSAREG